MNAIASGTPEGEPLLCPLCDKESFVAASTFPLFDAPCPHCGHLMILEELCPSVELEPDLAEMLKVDKNLNLEPAEEQWSSDLPAKAEGVSVATQGMPAIFLELCEITDPMEIGYLERDWAEAEKLAAEAAYPVD